MRRECIRRSSSTCSDPGMRSKRSISRIVRRIPRISQAKRGGSTGYDGYKKVNGSKLSALVDRNDLPLVCIVHPPTSMIRGSMDQHSKHLGFQTLRIIPSTSLTSSSLSFYSTSSHPLFSKPAAARWEFLSPSPSKLRSLPQL